MELRDEKIIDAPRERVWAALNDPDVLRQCIPGCQSLEKVDDTHLDAVASLKVGPVKATFNGHVELVDLNPPESYAIAGEGKGGVAGFAKGRADVKLIEEGPETTRLLYDAKAEVGGKLAQLGSRLIDSTAKKLAGEFFAKFKEVVEGPPAAAEPAPSPVSEAPAEAFEATEAPVPPTHDPAEAAAVSPAFTGAMQSAEPPARSAQPTAGADRAAAERFREEIAEGRSQGASSGGLPWKWIAAIVGAIVILALLFDVF